MIAKCLNCNQDYEQDTQGAICPHEVGGPNSLPPWPKPATGTPPQDALIAQAQSMFEHYLKCGYLPHMSAREATEWIAASRASGTEGSEALLRVRCMKHRLVPQINDSEMGGGECGECIRQHCWEDMCGLIAHCLEETPLGEDGQNVLATLEETLRVNGIGTFGVPNEHEASFAKALAASRSEETQNEK